MSRVPLPEGHRFERLRRDHARKAFHSGVTPVDDWLARKALQNQEKQLSTTHVLVDDQKVIAGYYTLAMGEIHFTALPPEVVKGLPQRELPAAVLAWLGVDAIRHRQGLGRVLLGQAMHECYEASKTFAFVAMILDCLTDDAKAFYQHWDFQELPGHPYSLFLTANRLEAIITEP